MTNSAAPDTARHLPATTVWLTMALFFAQPWTMGVWLALIPEMKAALGLNKAELAISLLGMPVALIPTLQVAARVVAWLGPRRLMIVVFPAQSAALLLALLAQGQWSLFAALAVFGVTIAFVEMGLNVYAGRLEKSSGHYIMSRCHGFWALGLMVGSAMVVVLAGVSPMGTALAVGVPSAVVGVLLAGRLPRIAEEQRTAETPLRRRLRDIPSALWLISLMVLGVSLTEGAMGDWSAVYMTERLGGDAARGALAVTVYVALLAMGRFAGDAMKKRLGVVRLTRTTVGIAIAGVLLLVLPLPVWVAWAGFALVGLGVSVGFPLGVSAAAALDDRYEGANIAIMTTVSIAGFLIGAPLIGFLSEATSLRVGLAVLLPILLLSLFLTRYLAPAEN